MTTVQFQASTQMWNSFYASVIPMLLPILDVSQGKAYVITERRQVAFIRVANNPFAGLFSRAPMFLPVEIAKILTPTRFED